MSNTICAVNKFNSIKLQSLPGGILKRLTDFEDFREVVMTFLNFQDTKSLSLVSKDMKVKITLDSSNVFWKSFYIQYFGQQPVIAPTSSVCMKTLVEEAQDEFNYILRNSNQFGHSVRYYSSSRSINNKEAYVINVKELALRQYYFSSKQFELYNSKEENYIEVIGGFLQQRVSPSDVKNCLIDHKFNFKFYKLYKLPVICDGKENDSENETTMSSVFSKREMSRFIQNLELIEKMFNHRLNALINDIVNCNVQFLLKNISRDDLNTLIEGSKWLTTFFRCRYSGLGVLKPKNKIDWSKKDVDVRYNQSRGSFLECNCLWISDSINNGGMFAKTSSISLLVYVILGKTSKILTEELLKTTFECEGDPFRDDKFLAEEEDEKLSHETSTVRD